MEWSEVASQEPLYLNLGGGGNCHPKKGYRDYVAVDINPPDDSWAIRHDLREALPLPDSSVTRIHSEDFLEHLTVEEIKAVLLECFRLLRTDGVMRIGVPDFNNPKDRSCLEKGIDPRDPKHVTMTNYKLMKELIDNSPFPRHKFYHYWDGEEIIQEPIDYSSGMIKRTPGSDPRCRRVGFTLGLKGYLADFAYKLSRGFNVHEKDLLTRPGHGLHVTSIIVDLFKG